MQDFCLTTLNLKKGFLTKIQNKTLNLTATEKFRKKTKLKRKLLKITTEKITFKELQSLHELWKAYFKTLVNLDPQKIFRAELMGSMIKVTKSKNVGIIGVSGIVYKETMNCFYIVTQDDKTFTLLKKESVFEIDTEDQIITIYGPNFLIRPYERVTKKVKIVGKLALE